MPPFELIPAAPEQAPILANLLELYAYDFSEFSELELGADGRFGYKQLPLYWSEPDRHPFLIGIEGRPAGLVLVNRRDAVWDMAEFFVLRRYRRRGIGSEIAGRVWRRFPGRWQVRVLERNRPAYEFWERAIAGFAGGPVAPVRVQIQGKGWQVFSFESMVDRSNGYEAIAPRFISARRSGGVGAAVVREWARTLPRGASVLDLGCGSGVPVSEVLIEEGLRVSGVDASPSMIAAFRERFPGAPCECSAVEGSALLNGAYDGVVAWGLLFLLDAGTQRAVIGKAARALKGEGKFLFTSPKQVCTWADAMTGLPSVSLGRDGYREILQAEGLTLVSERADEGDNWYYFASKVSGAPRAL